MKYFNFFLYFTSFVCFSYILYVFFVFLRKTKKEKQKKYLFKNLGLYETKDSSVYQTLQHINFEIFYNGFNNKIIESAIKSYSVSIKTDASQKKEPVEKIDFSSSFETEEEFLVDYNELNTISSLKKRIGTLQERIKQLEHIQENHVYQIKQLKEEYQLSKNNINQIFLKYADACGINIVEVDNFSPEGMLKWCEDNPLDPEVYRKMKECLRILNIVFKEYCSMFNIDRKKQGDMSLEEIKEILNC